MPVIVCPSCAELEPVALQCPLCEEGYRLRDLPAPNLKRKAEAQKAGPVKRRRAVSRTWPVQMMMSYGPMLQSLKSQPLQSLEKPLLCVFSVCLMSIARLF